MPARVLFVSLMPGLGGPARSLLGLLAGLSGKTERIVAAPPGAFRSTVLDQRAAEQVVLLPDFLPFGRARRGVQAAALARAWMQLPRSSTVVHCNGHSELALALPLVLGGVATVAHMRSVQPTGWMARARVAWRFAPRSVEWIAVSPMARDCLMSMRAASPEHIAVIPNPIDTSSVVGPRKREADGSFVLGYFGSRRTIKGYQLLPRILRMMRVNRDVRLRLYVADDASPNPQANNEVTAELRSLGVGVEFVGHQRDLRGEYSSCDLVIVPSLEESFGRVPLEAMANGVAVVAADVPVFQKLREDSSAIELFRCGDADDAARIIAALVEDDARRATLAAAGPAFVAAYAPSIIADRVAAVYERALHAAGASLP